MSAHGWSITYPQLIAFGARVLAVPGRGHVMCASGVVPFRLADGEILASADWFEAVRDYGGPGAVPDAVAPLPGAELLVLGAADAVTGRAREARIRCGSVDRRLLLHGDDDAAGPAFLGAEAAVWHEADNPVGRGGPDDARPPLIVDPDRPGRPVWLGPTSPLHPVRRRRAGIPAEDTTGDWPADASTETFHDAHGAFWADGLFPRDPLRITGVVADDVDLDLPGLRVSLAGCVLPEGEWSTVESRIHSVTVIPSAGIGAMIWRGSIGLGADIMGETVFGLVASLDDVDAPPRKAEELAAVAMERWDRPESALDDRPLLPPSLHDRVDLPFESSPQDEAAREGRREAAEAWALGEMGLERNPYADIDVEGDELAAQAEAAIPTADNMDPAQMVEVAEAVSAHMKERHGQMGLGDIAPPDPVPAVHRGDALEEEIERRLSAPYQTEHEVALARNLARVPAGLDADETLARLGDTRAQSPGAPLFWPPLELEEAAVFGKAVLARLQEGDLARHIDVSGAQVGIVPETDPRLAEAPDADEAYVWGGERPPPMATPGTLAVLDRPHAVRGRVIDGLLAEEAGWRGIVFEGCRFVDASFAKGQFENCEFLDCTFERVNVASATFTDCRFESCELSELSATEPVLVACVFDGCRLADVTWSEPGVRDVVFSGGEWKDVRWEEGWLVTLSVIGVGFEDVTFTMVRGVHTLFEDVTMHQVVATGRALAHATFRRVRMHRSGFVMCSLNNSVWEDASIEETGLTNCVLAEAQIGAGCEFRRCDLTGVSFLLAELAGARFIECAMARTVWSGADATGTWFFGSNLRGVDFGDARLGRGVFCDADLRETAFMEEEVIGADFRGTLRSEQADR